MEYLKIIFPVFFEAGCIGAGMGGSLFDNKLIKAKDYHGLAKHFDEIKKMTL